MKKSIFILLTLFSFSISSMYENNGEEHIVQTIQDEVPDIETLQDQYATYQKAIKSAETQIDFHLWAKYHLLPLKTLISVKIAEHYFDSDENSIGQHKIILLKLPEELLAFVLLCYQAKSLLLSPELWTRLFAIIQQNDGAKIDSLPLHEVRKLISISFDNACPSLALYLIRFHNNQEKAEKFELPYFIILLIEAIGIESLRDMDICPDRLMIRYSRILEILTKSLKDNKINLNNFFNPSYIDNPNWRGLTPLAFLTGLIPVKPKQKREFKTLSFLLENGADVNAYGGLALRSVHNTEDLITFLIQKGADALLNPVISEAENSVFEDAVRARNFDLAKTFLKGGTNINGCAYVIWCFNDAIYKNDSVMVKFFLDHNADIYLEDMQEITPYEYALNFLNNNLSACIVMQKAFTIKPQADFIRMIGAINKEFEDCESNTHIEYKLSIIKKIFLTTGSLNDQDEQGNTPLIAACALNVTDIAKAFIEHGADKNKVNTNGKTALLFAQEHQNQELIKLLMQ